MIRYGYDPYEAGSVLANSISPPNLVGFRVFRTWMYPSSAKARRFITLLVTIEVSRSSFFVKMLVSPVGAVISSFTSVEPESPRL